MATGHINDAIAAWADELAGLGGDEPLTRWRDAKVGTLDLSSADDAQRRALLDGEAVRVSRLFPHDPVRTTAGRSARRLAERLWRLESAHGIAAGFLGTGLASWSHPTSTRRPNVPILLRRLTVTAGAFGEPDLLLQVVGDAELNHRLLQEMAAQLGLRLTAEDLVGPAGELRYPVVVDRLREQAPPHVVDGFSISHRAVVGLMAEDVSTVARDLTEHTATIAAHSLVALATGASALPTPLATTPAPSSVTAAIDLDADQQRVLDEVQAGASLAVEAPAGTGATQVAAALCADAVARGRTVLVVAEASPRLHGVRRRLESIGLGGATLDLSDGRISPARLARDVLTTLDDSRGTSTTASATRARSAGADDADGALLASYVSALHDQRPDRPLSAYQAISASLAGPSDARTSVRLEAEVVARLDAPAMQRLRRALTDFVTLDGLLIAAQTTPWFGASPATAQEAETAVSTVERLRTLVLPTARDTGARAAVEVGMPTPTTLADLDDLATLLADVATVEKVYSSEVWAAPVERMAVALADRRTRREADEGPGVRERRALRKQAQALRRSTVTDDAAGAAAMRTAADVLTRWQQRCHDGRRPRTGEHAAVAVSAWASVREALATLSAAHPSAVDDDLDIAGAAARLASLADDAAWARRLPRLGAAAAELADAGLGPLVADLRERQESGTSITADDAVGVLDACVAASLAEQILHSDPVLADVTGDQVREAGERWRQADAATVVAAADAATQAWAQRVVGLTTQHPEQARRLRDAASGHGLATTRDLIGATWTTMSSARPVWLAGPLPAAAALPVDTSVDVLVVLDGQSMALSHAIGAVARARQVVVLADSALPPPTPTPLLLDGPDHRLARSSAAPETPSLYAVLRDHVPALTLTTRFGCRDGRLQVAAPARRDGLVVGVPPGSDPVSPLTFEHVPQEPGTREQEDTVAAEVARVVDLVREHVAGRPGESLAVLAVGEAHAAALEAALRRACLADAALAEALRPDADTPFLLTPIEDLVGQRRDAVILTVGFGRTMDGRLLYRYGPVNRPGGTRWLASAVATARRRLTVVSSVTASDLDPRRLAADGLRALQQLLASAEGLALDGLDDPAQNEAVAPHAIDPFERAVAAAIHDAGVPVHAGAGTGLLASAFGLAHPGRPSRGVLVVDPDGGVHASFARLRDRERLRPEALMRSGWQVHRIVATDWARDPDAELARVRDAWEQACRTADAVDAAINTPASEPPPPADAGAAAQDADRPDVTSGRPVDAYPMPDLVAVATWVEQTTPGLSTKDAMARLGSELALKNADRDSALALRRAVAAAAIASTRATGDPVPDAVPTPTKVDDPLPTLSVADEAERRAERVDEDADRDQWLEDERPPHH